MFGLLLQTSFRLCTTLLRASFTSLYFILCVFISFFDAVTKILQLSLFIVNMLTFFMIAAIVIFVCRTFKDAGNLKSWCGVLSNLTVSEILSDVPGTLFRLLFDFSSKTTSANSLVEVTQEE